MKIYTEISLDMFEAWSGGEDTLDRIIEEDKIEEFEELLEAEYPNGIDETDLNDMLRFEDNYIFEMLGIEIEEEE